MKLEQQVIQMFFEDCVNLEQKELFLKDCLGCSNITGYLFFRETNAYL